MDVVEKANEERAKIWKKEAKVGEGTYAVVYRGRNAKTGVQVAIKKIKVGQFKDGLDMSAIREVQYLRELLHPNVIQLLDVYSSKANLNLVLEYLDSDLEGIIKDRSNVFLPADIKSWMAMTLRGLEFCHRNWILHRDLKPNNLLISADGQLKLADFGLARDFAEPGTKMTSQVITRWYRPPELFFGARFYGAAVDIWSVGCIFAELMLRTPYLPGETDVDQLKTIFRALGTPTEEEWPGHTKLPSYVSIGTFPKSPLKLLFTAASPNAISLLQALLTYAPHKRPSARDALGHTYFTSLPHPTHPMKLPRTMVSLAPRAIPEENQVEGIEPGAKSTKAAKGKKRKAVEMADGDVSALASGRAGGGPGGVGGGDGRKSVSERARAVSRKLEF